MDSTDGDDDRPKLGEDSTDPPYRVGKNRPPLHTQFKPGNKAAARRRRKLPEHPLAAYADIGKLKVRVVIDGKGVFVTRDHAMALKASDKALKGGVAEMRYWDKNRGEAEKIPRSESKTYVDHGAEVRRRLDKLMARLKDIDEGRD